jgi:menaquinol-cytochrome c reductase iron-sulfur subunit
MDQKSPKTRRTFVAAITTIVAGTIAVVTPLLAGVVTFLSPLFKKSASPKVRVGLLSQVPDDGVPRPFPVIANRIDAWNRYPDQRIGSIYLIRQPGEEKPTAFTAKCPHAGCFIGYTPGDDKFRCPCHTSAFNLNGTRVNGDAEVAPRGMDHLPVTLVDVTAGDGEMVHEIWIEYIDFQTGLKEAVPTS